jgi:predicted ATPase
VALEGYVASRPEAKRSHLAQRYPALARCLPSLPVSSQPLLTGDHQGASLDLPAAGVRLLTDLAQRQPVVLVLGDLQDSDPLSLNLLRYLTQLAVTRRWLLLAALREEEVETGTELRRVIDAMTRERLCLRIEVPCLSRLDCDHLVQALLSGDRVDEEVLEQIYARSRGNPLFVDELVREMHQCAELVLTRGCWHRAPRAAERVPARVGALVAMRLATVNETVRRVLALAAAGGAPEISLRELRTAATALQPPISDGALLDALDRALRMGVLEEQASGYTFRYPLVRSAVYEALPRHRRDELRTALGRSRAQRSRRLRVAAAS